MVDDDFRCSAWTQAQGGDPIGSATPLDRLVVIEVPLPWPSDIADAPILDGIEPADGIRVQGVTPDADRGGRDTLVTCWSRAGAALHGIDYLVSPDDLQRVVSALCSWQPVDVPGTEAPAEILVCTHGSRDRCCGGAGTRLAVEVTAALGQWRVRRTTHLGGHRFAPTALTLPDGRCWAYLDADTLGSIARRTTEPADVRRHYRGNTALDGHAQAVEADLLTARGWIDFDLLAADVAIDGNAATVALQFVVGGRRDQVTSAVQIVNQRPVLQCGLGPEHASKTAPEYAVVAIR